MSRPGGTRPGPAVGELGDPDRVLRVVFGCRPADVAADVVVSPFVTLRAFRRHVEGEVTPLEPPFFYKGFTGALRGRRITVLWTGVGPSRVGDCLAFLSLTPARRVLFAGAVGGLAPEHAIGDYFLPSEAADGEGYTRYAAGPFAEVVAAAPRIPAPPGPLAEGLGPFLTDRGWPVRRGPVFTIGSVSFETPENLASVARAGYAALEMELSAFYAAARLHGLDAAALTYVSDLPLRSSLWAEKTLADEDALRRAFRALPELALEYLATR
ncbi:MAG: phosphorylase family protein [Deferrisomatales bacterium]